MTAARRSGLILVFLSTLAWSTAGLFTRAITESFADVLVWRGLFGTLGLLAVLLVRDGPGGLAAKPRPGPRFWAAAS
jgi:drug/metabolite transporter (DMT)-like permease